MELPCDTCTLRPLRPDDASSIARHANDRGVWLNLRDLFPHPYALADAERFIAYVGTQKPTVAFAIVVEGHAVGTVGVVPGHDVERVSAEIGYWLGRPFWGQGITTGAVIATTRYAFSTLGMHRVFATPFAGNAGSLRVLEKAGYRLEGLLRRSAIKDGHVLDQYLYAANDDTWSPGDSMGVER